ncbi:MAG: asparagine synthase (glutamine-hydrolyzing) [Candidatus Rokubacteria bacterium]|nr:asparagine synthase (glutamine-hydrolyzing) [Candidatus Rokubacteria bacterium]
MCGIAGIVSRDGAPVTLPEVRAMCDAMVHRGPDDEGFYLGAGVGLGMRRLSIIDLATGRQPVRNEDGTVWVVFNGEIYNYRELRRALEAQGHAFYTATDTETIVHLYENYGPRCVEHLRGMFAFALWDEPRRRLLLARDRLGIKPLYYADVGGRLLFASELKAIRALPGFEPELNWAAVSHLFTFLTTPRAESIVRGVRKLEPGHVLVASFGEGARIERYWDVQFEPDHGRPEADFVERLRELLTDSVRLHLVSDVPVGAFLSGGIDSSSVVATMARLGLGPVKTFSIGFTEADYDELRHARVVARAFGTEHHELTLDPDALGIVDELAWYLDEPFGDSSAIPTYMVSKLAAEHVTVVLSGDGGDELLAGYDKYRVERRERPARFLPGPARSLLGLLGGLVPEGRPGHNFLRHFALTGAERYLDASTLFRHAQKQKLFRPEAFELCSRYDPWRDAIDDLARADGHWLSALQYLDLRSYLPLDILTKVDRMSMAHSLEARVPLLDHKLVEFAATVPPELRLRGGTTKYLLKRAMRGILPDRIIERPKHGFAVPLARWFRGGLGPFVREVLLSERSRRRGILEPAYIERLLALHARGRDLDLQLWTLLSFELWCRTFLDGGRAGHGRPVASRAPVVAVGAAG